MQSQRGRFVVGLSLVVAVLVTACDGVTDQGDPSPMNMENVLAMPTSSGPLELVAETPDEVARGEDVLMKMVLRNTGDVAVDVEIGQEPFTNGTTVPIFNFFVFAEDTDVVRQRRTFFAPLGPTPYALQPNDTLEFEWSWDQRDQDGESVASGTYQVIGTLGVSRSGLPIRSEPVDVTIR